MKDIRGAHKQTLAATEATSRMSSISTTSANSFSNFSTPSSWQMASCFCKSLGATMDTDLPRVPALAVLPALCTNILEEEGMS